MMMKIKQRGIRALIAEISMLINYKFCLEAWDLWKRSWALWGARTDDELIKYLEIHMRESSMDVLESAENCLISDEPEALMRREMGLMKERQGKMENY